MFYKFFSSILLLQYFFIQPVFAYNFKVVVDQQIIPAYENLFKNAVNLQQSAQTYCENIDSQKITKQQKQDLDKQFSHTFLAWQAVQYLRFGPIEYLSRQHRLQLWPDKRGTVAKHLRRLLDSPELNQKDFNLATKSVAVQGFSALERLLFSATKITAKHCLLIEAISKNIYTISNNLLKDWNEGELAYRTSFIQPGPKNAFFESDIELASQLLNSLHTQLEYMLTQKLMRPLGKNIKKSRGKRSEAWRSQLGLAALSENINSCYKLYQITYLPLIKNKQLKTQLDNHFNQTKDLIKQLSLPLKQAVKDPNQRIKLELLVDNLSQLKRLIARDLTVELALSLGFNSLDGD